MRLIGILRGLGAGITIRPSSVKARQPLFRPLDGIMARVGDGVERLMNFIASRHASARPE
jgi:hypothetical protein